MPYARNPRFPADPRTGSTPRIVPAPRRVGRPPKAATLLRRLLNPGKPSRFAFLRLAAVLAEEAERAAREDRVAAAFLRDLVRAGAKAERLAARYARRAWKGGNR